MMRDRLRIMLGPASMWLAADLCSAGGPPVPSIVV